MLTDATQFVVGQIGRVSPALHGAERRLFRQFQNGVLACMRRTEPSRGRGRPCSPSREELAHGEQQARKREYDEQDLVDVLFAGRQSACEVHCPEDRVIPQGEPGPPFTASVRNRGDQEAEHPHPDRRHADRSQVWRLTRSRDCCGDETKNDDGDADDRERDPSGLEQDACALSHRPTRVWSIPVSGLM
jgi:hypothetical protein